VTHNNYAWLGLGVSKEGYMIDSAAVIGIPDASNVNVNKYYLNSKSIAGINKAEDQDSVYMKSIVQVQGWTTMEFETYLDWDYNLPFQSSGGTHMIFAYGYGNVFGYHKRRGQFLLNISGSCFDDNDDDYDDDSDDNDVDDDDFDDDDDPFSSKISKSSDTECSKSDDPNFDQMNVFTIGEEILKVYSKMN
jgi:hypothetical protein